MPMLKKYTTIAPCEELKVTPNTATIKAILNYSKSVEVKKLKGMSKVIVSLN